MPDCIFCKIAAKEIPTHTVWENEHFFSFPDTHPAQNGHILIIPKTHFSSVFALPEDLYKELFSAAKALSAPLQNAIGSTRIGMVIEGFGVDHAHLHLIPINHAHDMDSTNAKSVPDEELAANAAAIRQEIEKIK
jgi:histidine triad (HIT) family protein